MVDSAGLEAILNRLEAGKRLSKQDLKILVAAVRSQQVTIATGDRAVAIGGSADGAVIVTGDQHITITGANAEEIRKLIDPRPDDEKYLLKTVEDEVDRRLEQSLHDMELITINKQIQPEQVSHIYDADIKIGHKPAQTIAPDVNILKVFEQSEIAGRLLILGRPGIGKTTTMLELAKLLIDKANQNTKHPIPVVLNLSSWKDLNSSMTDWLIKELVSKYKEPERVSNLWLRRKRLVLMLDGLDEVKLDYQKICVELINQWLSDNPSHPLVVCSRSEEYSSHQAQLRLNGAILLQPLTDKQIQNHLSSVKRTELKQLLQNNAELLKLMRIPLFLSVTILAYDKIFLKDLQRVTSDQQRINLLLDAYVEQMLHKYLESRAYKKLAPPDEMQTKRWLRFLAKQLKQESQTEFLIEGIRLSWLKPQEQRIHGLVIGLLLGIYGASTSIILCLELIPGLNKAVPFYFLVLGIIGGLAAGSSNTFIARLNQIEAVEILQWSWVNFVLWLAVPLVSGPFLAAIVWVIGLIVWPLIAVFNAASLMKITVPPIIFYFFNIIFSQFRSIIKSRRNAIFLAIGVVIVCLIFKSQVEWLLEILVNYLTGQFINDITGKFAIFKDGIIKNFTDFNAVVSNLNKWSYEILVLVMSVGLIFGVIGGLKGRANIEKSVPNEGIWRSARSAVISLTLCTLTGIASELVIKLINLQLDRLNLIMCGLIAGSIIGWINGGAASIQHLLLRVTLHRSKDIPKNYAQFLDYCTERQLLQRVGGRYRFIHQLLQEHFAAMPLEEIRDDR